LGVVCIKDGGGSGKGGDESSEGVVYMMKADGREQSLGEHGTRRYRKTRKYY